MNMYVCVHANKTTCPPQCNHRKYQLPFPPLSFHIVDLQALFWPRLVHEKANQPLDAVGMPESSAPIFSHPKEKDDN